jgi:WD40 repeat protein
MAKGLRIFISSPGDVLPERRRAKLVIEALAKSYVRHFTIEPILWEVEPMLASGHFQDQIIPPSETDILVLIVWSRLGTALPEKTETREYRGIDDRVPVTGTEWEFEDALAAQKARGAPDLLAYRKQTDPTVSLRDKAAKLAAEEQWDKLDGFWNRWFVNRGEFRAAFSEFSDLDGFEAKLESDLRRLVEGRIETLGLAQPGQPTATWHQGSPYRGLDIYRFDDAPIFFGRRTMTKAAVEQLSNNAEAGRAFLLITGASGAGKSSLAQAGVLPALVGRGIVPGVGLWRRAVMRPAGHSAGPYMALAEALVARTALPELRASTPDTDALARHLWASADDPAFTIVTVLSQIEQAARTCGELLTIETVRLVLVVDQLEELFVSVDLTTDDRKRFIRCVDGLSRSGRVLVLATMRSDHWHHAAETPQLVDMTAGYGRLDLVPPVQDEIIEMIRQPAAAAGLAFESDPARNIGLDATLATEAVNEPGALPLLSFLLEELYKKDIKDGARTLTYASMQSLGGLKGAIAIRAKSVFDGLPSDAQAALPEMLRALVTVSRLGGAAAARIAPMTRFKPGSPERTLVGALLDPQVRLLVADGDGDGARVRLAHEALMTHWDLAKRLIARERDDLRTRALIDDALAEWRDAPAGVKRKYLLRDPLLSAAVDLARRWTSEFSAEARGFIEAARRRALVAIRLSIAATVAFAALAVAAVVFAEIARHARADAELAQSQVLADLAAARLQDGDAVSAMLLALDALPDVRASVSRPYEPRAESILSTARQAMRENLVLPGHTAALRGGVFSTDGKLIVTVSDDRTARVWDAASGQPHGRPLTLARGLRSVAFSPNGKLVAIGSFDPQARALLWDTENGRIFKPLRGHGGPVRGIAFSADGNFVATASDDHRAGLWNARTGENTRYLPHDDIVRCVAFSPDGKHLVTGSDDWIVRIWDVAGEQAPRLLRGHAQLARTAAYSPNGALIVTGSDDATARIWDVETGQTVHILQGHAGPVLSTAFSPDGRFVLTASEDKTIRIWNAATGEQVALLRGHAESVSSAAYSPDGKRIVSTSVDQTARLWKVEPDAGFRALPGPAAAARSVAFSRDGKRLVAALDDKTAVIWNVDADRQVGMLRGHEAAVRSAAFSPDGKRIVTASDDMTARVWDADSGHELLALRGHRASVRSAAFSPGGKRIVTASDDMTARVWDAQDGHVVRVLDGGGAGVRAAAFSRDGSGIVTASADRGAELWDADSGQKIGMLSGHVGEVASAEFGPDDRLIVTASPDDFTARLWNAQSRQVLHILRGHTGGVRRATFSADGRRVVTVSDDRTVRIWDVESGRPIAILTVQKAAMVDAVFDRDGRYVALASPNGPLLWTVFPDTQVLVDAAKTAAPRCLTPAQPPRAGCPPAWCIAQAKWPYDRPEKWKDWLADGCRASSPSTATIRSEN